MALSEYVELLRQRPAARGKIRAVLARLSSRSATLDDLITASALSRRGVENILRLLGEAVVVETSGQWALRADKISAVKELLHEVPVSNATEHIVEALRQARQESPPAKKNLDHVAATAETVVARAQWIARRFGRENLRILFIGDHDLTSIAVSLLCPGVQIAVVDIEEKLLSFLAERLSAARADFRLRHADLRTRFPADLYDWADIFVTDPPYTPEGVALFCARGAQGLREISQGRGLFAYGYGEEQPALGLAVQKALLRCDCVMEEIIPDFNRYHGAQAIGGSSDWYAVRFASGAGKKLDQTVKDLSPRLYTHGRQSVETSAEVEVEGGETTGAKNLVKQDESAVFRTLLWENGERLQLIVENNHPDIRTAESQDRLRKDVAGKWQLRFNKSTPDSTRALIEAEAVAQPSPQGFVLRRPQGKLKNVLREAHIVHSKERTGEQLTKNQSREYSAALLSTRSLWGVDLGECLVGDAPRHALRSLLQGLSFREPMPQGMGNHE